MERYSTVIDPEIRAFADFLMSGGGADLEAPMVERRAKAKTLRQNRSRTIPSIHSQSEEVFSGCRFRIYRPNNSAELPGIVFLHGGGWCMLDIDIYEPIIKRLALTSGSAVLAIDYPLAPEAPFPAAIETCTEFVRHVLASSARFGIRSDSLALAGDSAGANLAVAVALVLRDRQENIVNALGLVYGAYDLANETKSCELYGKGDLPLTIESMRNSRKNYVPSPIRLSAPLASPLNADLRGLPPSFLLAASHDPLFDENIAMAGRLGSAGCEVMMKIYPGAVHGFLEADSIVGSKVARRALEDLGEFISSQSRSGHPVNGRATECQERAREKAKGRNGDGEN
jgi:acetyl esterase